MNDHIYFNGKNKSANKIDFFLLISLVISLLFIPPIPLSSSFHLFIDEVFTVLIGVRLLQKGFWYIDNYVWLLIIFTIYILFVILINPHRTEIREYFELYKTVKFAIIYVFAIFCFTNISYERIQKILNISFIGLVIFNLLHYFDLFNFNQHVTILYDPNEIDVKTFGLYSDGSPGPKRMIGTFGNPNDNAVVFLFYFAYYFYQLINEFGNRKIVALAYSAFIMVLLCQSRTSLICILGLLICSVILNRIKKQQFIPLLFHLLIMIAITAGFTYFNNSSSQSYLANTEFDLTTKNSFSSRLDIWKYMIEEWFKKPIFGYGPNKAFMYSNEFYPESEYIFFLWRYGLIGLLLFLTLLFYPLYIVRKHKETVFKLLFPLIIVSITALSNTPLNNPKILIIIALIIGYCVSLYYRYIDQVDEKNS